jgi:hypothetical protein
MQRLKLFKRLDRNNHINVHQQWHLNTQRPAEAAAISKVSDLKVKI